MKRTILMIMTAIGVHAPFCLAAGFGSARSATPVLNTPEFSSVFGIRGGTSLKSDRCGQVRELEFIALPGTAFRILEEQKRGSVSIYRVETDEYHPAQGTRLYVDSRFLTRYPDHPPARTGPLPRREAILGSLRKSVGSPYVWGGNVGEGVLELKDLYFPLAATADLKRLTLAGLDCSGLLYQASGGWTPRNTSQLVSYGRGVKIAGKRATDIAASLEPLDLIVWSGHVLIVLDRETVIESRLECGKPGNGGVVSSPLVRRLREIMNSRRPADSLPSGSAAKNVFVIRRWYDQ